MICRIVIIIIMPKSAPRAYTYTLLKLLHDDNAWNTLTFPTIIP